MLAEPDIARGRSSLAPCDYQSKRGQSPTRLAVAPVSFRKSRPKGVLSLRRFSRDLRAAVYEFFRCAGILRANALWMTSSCGPRRVRGHSTKSDRVNPLMVVVAQLVRAPVCGTGGRGFDPPQPPHYVTTVGTSGGRLLCDGCMSNPGVRSRCALRATPIKRPLVHLAVVCFVTGVCRTRGFDPAPRIRSSYINYWMNARFFLSIFSCDYGFLYR